MESPLVEKRRNWAFPLGPYIKCARSMGEGGVSKMRANACRGRGVLNPMSAHAKAVKKG